MLSIKVRGIFKPGRLLAPRRDAEAEIHTDALSPYPRYPYKYFWAVERGRPGISVRHAGLLKFYSQGRWWRRKSVGPARAQNLRRQVLVEAMPQIKALAATWKGSIVDLVNRSAEILKAALVRVTPRRSGKLALSYRIDRTQ